MRYRHGWYERASKFLTSFLSSQQKEVSGRVIQQMSFTSTLLKLIASDGSYYLKSPAAGYSEVSITSEIAAIFPDCSPSVVVTSDELNRFVSKEFEHFRLGVRDSPNVIRQTRADADGIESAFGQTEDCGIALYVIRTIWSLKWTVGNVRQSEKLLQPSTTRRVDTYGKGDVQTATGVQYPADVGARKHGFEQRDVPSSE